MNIDREAKRNDFYFKKRDDLVHELLLFLTNEKLSYRELGLIEGLQSKKFRFHSYKASNGQIKWLLNICDRLDYKLRDWDWWQEMRVKYVDK